MSARLNGPDPSLIVPGMKKVAFLLAFSLIVAGPLAAQSTEFGVLFGGSKRIIKSGTAASGTDLLHPGFSFSNSSIDLYYGAQLDPATMFKIQVGRIEGPVAFKEQQGNTQVRVDAKGEVQHGEGIVEYRFSEPFGSAGLFAGVGIYRTQASGFDSKMTWGIPVGLTADFPLSRRYGIITAITYHYVDSDFHPRYLTAGAGLRLAF